MLKDFRKQDGFTLIAGNKSEKAQIFSEVISESLSEKDAVTIILDRSGDYYSRFGKDTLLTDYVSVGSCVLDFITPILEHNYFCGNVNEIVENIFIRCFERSLKPRDANDQFWVSSSNSAFKEYLKSLLYLFRWVCQVKQNDASCFFGKVGSFASVLLKIMNSLASGQWNKETGLDTYIANDCNVADLLVEEACKEYGEWCVPFQNTLYKKPSSSNSNNTCNTILQDMIATYSDLFSAMEYAERNNRVIASLPVYDIRALDRPVFVCRSGNRGIDNVSAALLIFALSLITDRKINLIIPEIDKWQVLDALSHFSEAKRENLSVVFGYASLRSVSYSSEDSEGVFEKLQAFSDRTIYCNSSDPFLKSVFNRDVCGLERRYELNELGDNCCVEVSSASEVEYCALPEVEVLPCVPKPERIVVNAMDTKPWIAQPHALKKNFTKHEKKKRSKLDDDGYCMF